MSTKCPKCGVNVSELVEYSDGEKIVDHVCERCVRILDLELIALAITANGNIKTEVYDFGGDDFGLRKID